MLMAAELFEITSLFFLPESFACSYVVAIICFLCHARTSRTVLELLSFCSQTSKLSLLIEVGCVPLECDDQGHEEDQGCQVQKQDSCGDKIFEEGSDEMAGTDRNTDNQKCFECSRHGGMMLKCF